MQKSKIRKKIHTRIEKERDGDSPKRKAINSDEENSDFDNGLDFHNEQWLKDKFSDDNIEEDNLEEPKSNAAVEEEMRVIEECWRYLSPPTKEKDLERSCIFEHRKVPSLYEGQILKRFLNDEAGLVVVIELDCLQQKLGSSDSILRQGTSDICVFPVKNVIADPL